MPTYIHTCTEEKMHRCVCMKEKVFLLFENDRLNTESSIESTQKEVANEFGLNSFWTLGQNGYLKSCLRQSDNNNHILGQEENSLWIRELLPSDFFFKNWVVIAQRKRNLRGQVTVGLFARRLVLKREVAHDCEVAHGCEVIDDAIVPKQKRE
jgi:hypothetical protein